MNHRAALICKKGMLVLRLSERVAKNIWNTTPWTRRNILRRKWEMTYKKLQEIKA